MYFRNLLLGKRSLDKCLKRPVSEDLFTSNMVNEPKYCCNRYDSTSTIFIN